MPLPDPEPGLIISYAYLWRYEHDAGRDEGRKVRPCVIIVAMEEQEGNTVVTVAPITHSIPKEASGGIEIPHRVKQHIGLDDQRSWVILNEVNQFAWPGYDLQPVGGCRGRYDYGFLPPRLFEKAKAGILDSAVKRRLSVTNRD